MHFVFDSSVVVPLKPYPPRPEQCLSFPPKETETFECPANNKRVSNLKTVLCGPPLHVHPHQDEIFFIVQGEYLFQVGDDKHALKAGDTIFLPRTVPHTFAQLTDNGKMFFLFQPSGKMEDFFTVLGNLTSPPTPEQGAKIFADHDMKVVGPPLQY